MTENSALVEVPTAHWLDALLDRLPLRRADLAMPPLGSGLKPVGGDRGLPFVGLGVHTLRYGPAFQIQLLRRHGPVSWWQAFGRRIVAAAGPDAVQAVLANKDKAFVTGWPSVVGPWFDGGLLAMDSAEHLTDRRLMQAAYGDAALDGYRRHLVDDVDAATATWPVGTPMRVVPAVRQLSRQITTSAFLGVRYEPEGKRIMQEVEACIRAETALVRLGIPGTSWRRAQRARRRLTEYLLRAVPAARVREGTDFFSVLSRLPGFSDRKLAEHMLFTLIASHDTTTAAMIAAIYFLGKNPQWQRVDDLELVVKESIRLVSPSPILMRVAVKDTEILGHYVPAGQLVSVCTGVNQLLPELWPEPHRFDPDRFLRHEDRVHRLAWAPFGAGAHKCIGMRLGLVKVEATLAALVRRFSWSLPVGYEAPWRFMGLPAPSDGLPVVLHQAERASVTGSASPRRTGTSDSRMPNSFR